VTLDFVSGLIGFMSNSNGDIFATEDGGKKWLLRPTKVSVTLKERKQFGVSGALCFQTRLRGWRLDDDLVLRESTDGGRSWNVTEGPSEMEVPASIFKSYNGRCYLMSGRSLYDLME
jgi:photosystem II stability/assembly factor-like uncharacterized protein